MAKSVYVEEVYNKLFEIIHFREGLICAASNNRAFYSILYRVFFLSDIFETLITLSILKISSFCKVVMTNKTGQFDNLFQKIKIYFSKYSKCPPSSWLHILALYMKLSATRRRVSLGIREAYVSTIAFSSGKVFGFFLNTSASAAPQK